MAGIITQPARPKGRTLRVSPCPVGEFAREFDTPVLTPQDVNAPESLATIRALAPDLLVVIAYGQFLKPELLHLPFRGCINLHPSLLPAYRGAAPIQWAIARGESVTGITVMYIDERMDAGDIVLREETAITAEDDAGTVHDRLAEAGAGLMLRAVDAIEAGTARRVPQDEGRASFAPKLRKSDGRIQWARSSRELYNHVRGFYPWPGCHARFRNERGDDRVLKVLQARIEPGGGGSAAPGTVLDVGQDGPLVATGDGALRLRAVQPEDRKRMTGADFLRGYKVNTGDLFA